MELGQFAQYNSHDLHGSGKIVQPCQGWVLEAISCWLRGPVAEERSSLAVKSPQVMPSSKRTPRRASVTTRMGPASGSSCAWGPPLPAQAAQPNRANALGRK